MVVFAVVEVVQGLYGDEGGCIVRGFSNNDVARVSAGKSGDFRNLIEAAAGGGA